MLSNNQSFRKLNILSKKKSKVEPSDNVSLEDLAFLVKRLSVQVDDLVTTIPLPVEQQPPAPIPQPNNHYLRTSLISQAPVSHTTVDPWASYVPQNYGALLQRLEDIESLQKCPNDCCSSTGTVSSADGVPWPQPIEPFQACHDLDSLDTQYTHWCTLMRCLPLMDPITSAHVKTVGLYAMREILKSKASQKREQGSSQLTFTSTKLRDSLSCLGKPQHQIAVLLDDIAASEATVAETAEAEVVPIEIQDMPAWMSKTATESLTAAEAPMPPPKETTPVPSAFSTPLNTRKRFQKWVQYKKSLKKTSTDATPTPLGQSQNLKKIGSWFF